MRLGLGMLAVTLLMSSCGPVVSDGEENPVGPTVRVLLVGDVMLGRGVANVVSGDADSTFEGVRHLLADADVTAGNLESPLTDLRHISSNENALEADPAAVSVLRDAGFDLMSVANNHATDAGGAGLLDTLQALRVAGLKGIGGGRDRANATAAATFDINGIGLGFVAFDATEVAETATDAGPGVATWDDDSLEFIRGLIRLHDILIVSIHGGTEYLRATDPGMAEIGAALADAGVDVVWGHGAHVTQPIDVFGTMHSTVVATSLGNFLFDQSGPERTTGTMLEVMADENGAVAYRVGVTKHPDRRVEFVEWLAPSGNAVYVHDSWWSLVIKPAVAAREIGEVGAFDYGDLITTGLGDINGDGSDNLIASFRRPHQTTPFMDLHPDAQWQDALGRSAHLGVYDPDGQRQIWVAGSVLMPIAQFAVCDDALATIHDQLDDPTPVASGAWEWNGFGFDTAPTITGGGTPGCTDIDGDGRTEPVILDR